MRLIDADVVERKIDSIIAWVDNNLEVEIFRQGCKASLKDLASTIKCYIPIIDAAPVVHGHWEFKDDFGNRDFDFIAVCSRCGNKKNASGYSHSEWITEWRYCNACGTKMDEEVEHETD